MFTHGIQVQQDRLVVMDNKVGRLHIAVTDLVKDQSLEQLAYCTRHVSLVLHGDAGIAEKLPTGGSGHFTHDEIGLKVYWAEAAFQ